MNHKTTTDIEHIAGEISVIMPEIARYIVLEFFQSVQIPQSQIFAMLVLDKKVSCRFTELSRMMHVSAPTATGIIDRLERAGYASRKRDEQDRRAVNVCLTPQGMKITRKLRALIRKRWVEILSQLSVRDRKQYLRLMRRIQDILNVV